MDESVELFHAEQQRLAEEGGPVRALRRQIRDSALGLGIFVVMMVGLLAFLNWFPRNPDHSMKLVYYGPILTILGFGSLLVLRRPALRQSPFRFTAWGFILMALAAIPAGAIDLYLRASH
jgi:hypothetical protein